MATIDQVENCQNTLCLFALLFSYPSFLYLEKHLFQCDDTKGYMLILIVMVIYSYILG